MTEIQNSTSLHEGTVRRAEELSSSYEKPRRKRKVEARPRSTKVDHLKVDERVHREALRLAGGDASRITILDGGTVLVR